MTLLDVDGLSQTAREGPAARLIVLFGSVAREEQFPWSDLDVGISGVEFWRGLEIGSRLGAVLGREAHVVDLDTASDWLRFQVARDGILLHEGEPGVWARFLA